MKEEAERIGLDLGKLENVDALKIERILYQRDLQIKRQGEIIPSESITFSKL